MQLTINLFKKKNKNLNYSFNICLLLIYHRHDITDILLKVTLNTITLVL